MRHRVKAVVAQVSAHEGGVLLLDSGVVVFVKEAAAGKLHSLHNVAPEAQHMLIQEFSPIVRMNLMHAEGQADQETQKSVSAIFI